MPLISTTDRRSFKGRVVVALIYLALTLGGVAMVYPFLVMLTGSVSNTYDFERRSLLPRYFGSQEDRFVRTLCAYFPPTHRGSIRQLRSYFTDLPKDWLLWPQIGDNPATSDAWARRQLDELKRAARLRQMEEQARDYGEFMETCDLRETVLAFDNRLIAPFLRERYGSLERLNQAWRFSVDDFYKVSAAEWSGEPLDQPTYVPPVNNVRYTDFAAFREAYRKNRFTPYLGGVEAPAGYLRPASLRFLWEDFVLTENPKCDVAILPFPVPPDADPATRGLWQSFLKTRFPMRHIEIPITPSRRQAFRAFLIERFRDVRYLSRVLELQAGAWDDVPLTATIPSGALATVWCDFVRLSIPVDEWNVRDTLPEQAFQKLALRKHGSLEAINAAYGLRLAGLQQLRIPFREAFLVTFHNREWSFFRDQLTTNYRMVLDYLFYRGSAVTNTLLLALLSILVTLTVNPMAGYALSRFNLPASEKVIVFCLATMSFPAAVSAIPGFLLLRDLRLLNTFAALVLPGAASGMAIFMLKGFFDSLPKELFEAATIDGASEWSILFRISLPLIQPILAVNMLGAFVAAYSGWEWALIVCQKPTMWTIAVWTYQFSQSAPSFAVMAAYVLTSIPVLLVFLFCQRVILRGIILPEMK